MLKTSPCFQRRTGWRDGANITRGFRDDPSRDLEVLSVWEIIMIQKQADKKILLAKVQRRLRELELFGLEKRRL